jgi:hypothetical protein
MAALRGGHPALTDRAAQSGRARPTSPHFGRAHTAPRISGPARSPPRRMLITPAVRCPQSRTSPEFRVSSSSLQTICRSYQHAATGWTARGRRRRLLPVFLRRPLAPWERRVDRHPRDSSCDGQKRGFRISWSFGTAFGRRIRQATRPHRAAPIATRLGLIGATKRPPDTSRPPLLPGYSHSMVPGGFDVTSSTTRFTPGTSFVMRFEMRASTS